MCHLVCLRCKFWKILFLVWASWFVSGVWPNSQVELRMKWVGCPFPTHRLMQTSPTHLPANTPTHWQVANPPTACKTHPLRIYANPPTHLQTHHPTAFNTHVTTHNWQQIQHLNLSLWVNWLDSKLCELIPYLWLPSGLRCECVWGVGLINGISQPITSGDISRSCLSLWVTDPSKASHIYTPTIHNLFSSDKSICLKLWF